MTWAVTGASGFIGAHLVCALEGAKIPVVRIVRQARGTTDGIALRDVIAYPRALPELDVLVHAAAVRHRHGVGKEQYRVDNVELVERLMRACQGRLRRFVYVSSVGVYGFPTDLPIRETHPFSPATLYGETKVEAEALVRRLAPELGMEFTIVRPTIVYGKGDTNGMLDKMVHMIRRRRYLIVGDGENTLHHTHVDDMVQGIRLAGTVPAANGQEFILSGPETTTLRTLSERVARHLGVRLLPGHVNLRFARVVASGFDALTARGVLFADREPPINHEKLDVMTRSICFDSRKAREVLGYLPQVTYDDGLRRTLA